MKNVLDRLRGLFAKDKGTGTLATVLMIAAVVLFNVVVFTLTSAFGLYIYSPEYIDVSISGNTDAMFEGLSGEKEVTVTFCMEEDDLKNHETGNYVYKTVNQLRERYSFIKVKFVNMLTKRDENGELFPLERYKTDMRGKETPVRSNTVIFSSGENYRTVTDTSTSSGFASFFALNSTGEAYAYCGEEIVASMIAWVLNDTPGGERKVAYMTEKHGETADLAFANMLTCAGYYIEAINLREKEVPDDAGLVVISNPTTDFYRILDGADGRSEIERLERYLYEKGGSLYVSIDPLARTLPILEGFLAEWGIELSGVTNEDGTYTRALVKDTDLGASPDGYSFLCNYGASEMASEVSGKISSVKEGRVMSASSAALILDETKNTGALLTVSSSASLVAGGKTVDTEGGYAVAGYSSRNNDNGTSSKVVVVPTIYLTASDALTGEGYTNREFLYSVIHSLGADALPIGCNITRYSGDILENFTMRDARLYTAIVLAVPACLALVGGFIIIRRKNR